MKAINNFLQEAKSFEKKDSVKVIVKCPTGSILILRRQNDDNGGGDWDIPGGCIEDGENHIEAGKREVFEETNLKIDNIKKFKNVTFKIPEIGVNSVMHLYKADAKDYNIELKLAQWHASTNIDTAREDIESEHTEYKWIDKKTDLENLPMIEELKKVILSVLE